MKIVFFGPSLTRARADRRSRILHTLLEGVVRQGHHVVYVEPGGADSANTLPLVNALRYDAWASARDRVEAECAEASAVCVVSGFAAGHEAVDWLLELEVPARAYYELDPWETLGALDAEGAAPWIRGDQFPAFHIVFSAAGGPGTDPFKTRWGAAEAVTLYEAIDPAVFHPRSPSDEVASDLLMVADRHAASEAALDGFVVEAARAVPERRFVVAGAGWDGASSWPENVELVPAGSADERATLYSSARLVLVPQAQHPVDHAMPIELLEPAACAAACAVVDRPGLPSLFRVGDEILVPASSADIVPLLASYDDAPLRRLGNLAEKRVVLEYTKLRAATRFEQRLARKYYQGREGFVDYGHYR